MIVMQRTRVFRPRTRFLGDEFQIKVRIFQVCRMNAALAWSLLNSQCCWLGTSVGFQGFSGQFKKEISIMLWTILVILLVLWLIGLLSNVGGSLIHLLLVVAVVVLIINLVTGRRAV
jgi:hypothetical protein